jgi:hypothetical protein
MIKSAISQIPESIRLKLVKAGKARAARITHEERVEWGKRSWAKRIEAARREEGR